MHDLNSVAPKMQRVTTRTNPSVVGYSSSTKVCCRKNKLQWHYSTRVSVRVQFLARWPAPQSASFRLQCDSHGHESLMLEYSKLVDIWRAIKHWRIARLYYKTKTEAVCNSNEIFHPLRSPFEAQNIVSRPSGAIWQLLGYFTFRTKPSFIFILKLGFKLVVIGKIITHCIPQLLVCNGPLLWRFICICAQSG